MQSPAIIRSLFFLPLFLITGLLSPARAAGDTPPAPKLALSALHPILGDLARRIGGEQVEVVDLLAVNGNLHAFEPSSEAIRQAGRSEILFVSGKKIEPYLPKLRDALPAACEIVDVGATIPDVLISPENAEAACCEDHDHDHSGHNHGGEGAVDPHWWHSMDNIKRAARTIEESLARKRPAHAADFARNRAQVEKECDRLRAWGKRQIMRIPQKQRILITGHAAFGHLCKELGFTQIAVQGTAREDEGAAAHLAAALKRIREQGAVAVFPEYQANPKVLEEIAKSLGLKTGRPLVSDGTAPEAHTFPTLYKYNIEAIVNALAPPAKTSAL